MKYVLFAFVLVSNIAFSQGLKFDKEAYLKGEKIEKSRADVIPPQATLKPYTPYVHQQHRSTCVAYSLATARTILMAKKKGLTDQAEISTLHFSPHWIYYQNKTDSDTQCEDGIEIEKAVNNLMQNGVPFMCSVEFPDYYPFEKIELCDYYPPSEKEDSLQAIQWALKAVYRADDLEGIKIAVSKGMPVVICMRVPYSFEEAEKQSIWNPTTNDDPKNAYGHALVLIAYDDEKYGGAVRLMNSWGETWGDNGFIWVRYDDFAKFAFAGYALYDSSEKDDSLNALQTNLQSRKTTKAGKKRKRKKPSKYLTIKDKFNEQIKKQ